MLPAPASVEEERRDDMTVNECKRQRRGGWCSLVVPEGWNRFTQSRTSGPTVPGTVENLKTCLALELIYPSFTNKGAVKYLIKTFATTEFAKS